MTNDLFESRYKAKHKKFSMRNYKKSLTKHQIIQAYYRLESKTIDNISAEAVISRGTFFNYFDSMDVLEYQALCLELLKYYAEEIFDEDIVEVLRCKKMLHILGKALQSDFEFISDDLAFIYYDLTKEDAEKVINSYIELIKDRLLLA